MTASLLREVGVRDFRNYEEATLALEPGITVLHGANGQGKTNLLEAIHLLATGASHRAAGPETFVRTGAEAALVRARVDREGRPHDLVVEVPRRGRMRGSVDGTVARRRSDLLGVLRAVMFSPDDLTLVKGGPSGRRAFIDETAILLRPLAADRQTRYDRVVRQRTALLRAARPQRRRPTALDSWDGQLVEQGMAVLGDRLDALDALEPVVAAVHGRLAPASGPAALTYRLSWGALLRPGERPDRDSFTAALQSMAGDEAERALSLVGPHRDDLVIALGPHDARGHASQGEARTLSLSLRLAVHRLVTGAVGDPPVLLLDDVTSELDPARSSALLLGVESAQTIITTADPPGRLPLPPGARCVEVVGGRLGPPTAAA